jgi:hypothetical protein
LIAFNAGHEQRDCFLPEGKTWYRIIDTNLPSPKDFCEDEASAFKLAGGKYGMHPYSCIVLKTFQGSADAVNYGGSDSTYAAHQDLEEIALRLKTIAGRQMSGELLSASSIEPEQVRMLGMLNRRSSMSGCLVEVVGDDGEAEYAFERPEDEAPDISSSATNGTAKATTTVEAVATVAEEKSAPASEVEAMATEAVKETNLATFLDLQEDKSKIQGGVRIRFLATVTCTQPGDTVYVVGDLPGLGAWTPERGLLCKTTAESFPVWTSQVLTIDKSVKQLEFKLVICGSGRVRWEEFPGNHKLELPTGADALSMSHEHIPEIDISCRWETP